MHFLPFIIHVKERHGVFSSSADPHLQMQMVSCHPPGVTHIADDLSRLHLLTGGDADGRTVGVQRFQPIAVVDLDVVAVAAAPAVKTVGNGDGSICSGEDRCSLGTGNVGAGVGTDLAGEGVNAVPELSLNSWSRASKPLFSRVLRLFPFRIAF